MWKPFLLMVTFAAFAFTAMAGDFVSAADPAGVAIGAPADQQSKEDDGIDLDCIVEWPACGCYRGYTTCDADCTPYGYFGCAQCRTRYVYLNANGKHLGEYTGQYSYPCPATAAVKCVNQCG